MKIQELDIAKLSKDPSNARKHDVKNLEAIKGSLQKFGQQKPIVIDAKGIVVAGNGTLEAAKQLGWTKINAVRTELTGTELTAYAIADNRSGELAEWDVDVLGQTLTSLKEMDFDLGSIGFDEEDLLKMLPEKIEPGLTEDDAVPENVETRCKPGDLWVLGEHRLLCGDSTNVQHVERLMGGEKADMVYCDPPYGINLEVNYKERYGHIKSRDYKNKIVGDYGKDSGIDLKAIIEQSFNIPELFIWGADNYPDCLPRGGSWVVWDKSVAAVDGIASDFELCWSRERHHYSMVRKLWKGAKAREETGQEGAHRTRWGHPTQKPIELAVYFFEHWGKKSKNVLDYFLGSGTSLIACEKTNRKCYGMEIDPHYCDVILTRWEQFTGRQASLLTGKEQDAS